MSVALTLTTCCLSAAACSSSSSRAGGPTVKICDQSIGAADRRPGGPAWYIDVTSAHAPHSITLAAPATSGAVAQGVWVRVSTDCTAGAQAMITPAKAAQIGESISTSDHRYAAIELLGTTPGTAQLRLLQAGSSATIELVTPRDSAVRVPSLTS